LIPTRIVVGRDALDGLGELGLAAAACAPFVASITHPRPFLAAWSVGEEHLSLLVPHVNNVEYLRWVDRLAELHADALGHTRARLVESDRCFFVARHEIDYHGECMLGDELVGATWVSSMKRSTSWRETRIARVRDGVVVATARTLWAFVDLVSRRAVRVPAAMAASFDPLDPSALTASSDRGEEGR
jgi:acyl-CoA thioester hydrolase